jgi:hypothetical protein
MSASTEKSERSALTGVLVVMLALIGLAAVVPDAQRLPAWGERPLSGAGALSPSGLTMTAHTTTGEDGATVTPTPEPDPAPDQRATGLPHGATSIFGDGRFLVAYYGTAETGALGVLGETPPDVMSRRVQRAAAPFARRHQPVQVVYELIVSIADRYAGGDGDYSHDIARSEVQKYIDAAHEHDALLLLDIQPGRGDFLAAAKRWAWALEDPYVGLALDPEWRLGRHGVPGSRIGSVDASEVNRVSSWLRDLVAAEALPQKLFVLHQFRTDMIDHIGAVEPRRGLVMVQHVDGFGTPGQKLDTFHAVARPGKFLMGFKLFYDEDVHRMSPADVRRINPRVRFVSFQ